MNGPHRPVNSPHLVAPSGFSHAVVADAGTTVWVAGQIAVDDGGVVRGDTFAAQFDLALGNVMLALEAAGARAEHVVAMTIFTTDMDAYRQSLRELGPIWRRHMDRHYPAVALLGIAELVEPLAMVEIVTTAVVPTSL